MSFQAVIAGQSFTLPETGDSLWGDQVSQWMAAVSTKLLQKSGGLFTLTAEVDFGATYGLKSAYYKSRGSNPATAGIFRMSNAESVSWRNAANSANLSLSVDSANQLVFAGEVITNRSHVIDVTTYGAVGNGTTDDTSAINAAIAAATSLKTATLVPVLWFPSNYVGFKITAAITIPAGISVVMDSEVLYVGSSNIVAVTIGAVGASNGPVSLKLYVRRNTQSDWTSEDNVGVRLYNVNTSQVEVFSISRFTINLQLRGEGSQGVAYNNFYLGNLTNGKVGLDLDSVDGGYVNENLFLGGRFGDINANNPSITRYGVRITSADSYENNNNHFQKPCFEMGGLFVNGDVTNGNATIANIASTAAINVGDEIISGYFPVGVTVDSKTSTSITLSAVANGGSGVGVEISILRAVCALIEFGTKNKFDLCRSEGNNLNLLTTNSTSENVFNAFYDDYDTGSFDRSTKTNYSEGPYIIGASVTSVTWRQYPVFQVLDIRNKVGPTNASGYLMCPSLSWKKTVDSTTYFDSQATLTLATNYVSIPATTALGAWVDTNDHKRFILDRQAATNGGRVVVQCYNAAGTILTNADAQHPLVRGQDIAGAGLTYTTDYGGAYVSDADAQDTFYFDLKDNVKSIWVGVAGGTAPATMSALSLFSVDPGTPATRPNYSGKQYYFEKSSDVAPVSGTWNVGEIVWNKTPTVDQPMGWLCTVTGTPGTWVAMPNLGARVAAGSVGTPSLSFTSDTNTGFYNPSADALGATVGGALAMLLEPGAASYSVTLGVSGSTKDYLFHGRGINLAAGAGQGFLLYRGNNDGFTRVLGGAGTSSGHITCYGSTHANAEQVVISNNGGDRVVVAQSGIVNIAAGVRTKISTANVSNPPTDAELDSAFGTPATVGSGFYAFVNDNNGGTNEYCVWSDGTNWFYTTGTKAL